MVGLISVKAKASMVYVPSSRTVSTLVRRYLQKKKTLMSN